MTKSKQREQETFSTDGGSFQFANEEEVKKFQVFLKLLDKEHKEALTNQRKDILEEVRSKVEKSPTAVHWARYEDGEFKSTHIKCIQKNKLIEELSLLEGEK